MIPSLLAQDVAKSLREFIITGFETDTWPFAGKFEQFVQDQNDGEAFVKGPYFSLSLPFAKKSDRTDLFNGFHTEHSPFAHQEQAWTNLKSDGKPKSSLVATGTGSGKTECFLYPLLDHCLRNQAPGIKAIVIYPMNALAGDQAKRFAEVVHTTPELKGKVRVGLFVGGESEEKVMSEKSVITSKNELRKNPPDILLTNYKMLDFLLMRPKDQSLWKHNTADTLKYLIVDELHTFDGAQGSDLAMLIRRLKARLDVKSEDLICAGTSATLGSEAQMGDLADYASEIFDTTFSKSNIIGEQRESQEDFLSMIEYAMLNSNFTEDKIQPHAYDSFPAYQKALAKLFFGDDYELDPEDMKSRQKLGSELKKHLLTHNLLRAANKGVISLNELLSAIRKAVPASLNPKSDANATAVLAGFLTLISLARGSRYPGEPFMTVRVQLWARELKRIVARVGTDTPQSPVQLQYSDDLKSRSNNEENGDLFLPVVQCSECHSTAWVSSIKEGESCVQSDLREIYTRFFALDKQVRVFLPLKSESHQPATQGLVQHLCSHCGNVQTSGDQCSLCSNDDLVQVFQPDLNKAVRRGGINTQECERNCPVCQSQNSLILFGSQAASLSAVAIHQMFANPINDDKKLIAFSDSVQDAAHRAGFFASRTWHNNIRMAIAKAIHHGSGSKDIPLQKLYTEVSRYWLEETSNPERMNKERFITEFIPPNLQSLPEYENLKTGDTSGEPYLLKVINQRLCWESLCELGLKALVGRSLERAGVATLTWKPELIATAAEKLVFTVKEQTGYRINPKHAAHYLWGTTLRMKRQGAIYDPELNSYIEKGGDYYIISNISWMPSYSDRSILPRFPFHGKTTEKGFEKLVPKKQSTWYSRWISQSLDGSQLIGDDKEFIEVVLLSSMKVLKEVGLVLEKETHKGNKIWALNPEALSITNRLGAMHLKRPDDSESYGCWYMPEAWLDALDGMPSLDQTFSKTQATATYALERSPRQSMYKHFYLGGIIKRVIGHEHTALLERDYREQLEKRFMAKQQDRKDWYENLLSATPTLEMGIDIGDLSSVLLCSVPPNQANYLQRSGRGGRKDGNSFVLTVANGKPHDLYFYAEPLKMLAGDVQAPAIFLNASMVLRRQLLAFCFDQWGMQLNSNHDIPDRMQPVLNAVKNEDQKKFPYTILGFISKNRDELWDKFNALLGDEILDETRQNLKSYLIGSLSEEESLHVFVLSRIKNVVDERERLVKLQKELEIELKKILTKPKDDARDEIEKELSQELGGVKHLKSGLNRKQTMEFLTDDGLLPNYAFPEEGTTLRSVIYKRLSKPIIDKDGKTRSYEEKIFEYQRPAQAALSELVPESVFYATNRKVRIERVEMARGENLEQWRLCPSCSYSQHIQGADKDAVCPKCGDQMWADNAQLKPMVKLKQVYASTREDKAFISDDSDTREPTFYNRQMLIDFDHDDVLHAYALKTETKPFGFEFIKKANFQEINFGKHGNEDQMMNVAGRELSRPGFKLCKECGMVQGKKTQHMFKCSYKGIESDDEQQDTGIIDCLYLYRQYESEAIRILMPKLTQANADQQRQSFVAAIQLGLKKRFGGKVDHINILTSDEPIPGSEDRSNYLVLYDTVPGGTGYLHTLLSKPENLMDTLKLSHQIMDKCECQHSPDTDGCYNCLFAYKNSYGMEDTSRTVALQMLTDILEDGAKLEPIHNLSKVKKDVWADSELESRFPHALQALNGKLKIDDEKLRVRVTKDIVKGKVGFKLEVGDLIYTVEPHVKLNAADGVGYPCEPDFLISLDRSGEDVKVAVFLDGYRYHKDIVHDDFLKRQGISLNTKMLTWSLTWQDINHNFAGNETKIPKVLNENTEKAPSEFIHKAAAKHDLLEHGKIAEFLPLQLLLRYLAQPDRAKWTDIAMLRTLSWLDKTRMTNEEENQKFSALTEFLPSQLLDLLPNDLFFHCSQSYQDPSSELDLHIAGTADAVRELDSESLMLTAIYKPLKDTRQAQTDWQRSLQFLNIGQFLPKFYIGTHKGTAAAHYANLQWEHSDVVIDNHEWDAIANLVDEEAIPLIHELAKTDIPLPKVGYELTNKKGMSVAEAELAWPDSRVAYLLEHQVEDCKKTFEAAGWKILSESETTDDLIKTLNNK